jgi:hypothetical protein
MSRAIGLLGLLCILVVLSIAGIRSALAASPHQLFYQGRLLDDGGHPVSSNVTVWVGIYTNDTGGASVYEESIGSIAVQNGVYSFTFGSDEAGLRAALLHPACWLELHINGNPLLPRQRLVAVPYSVRSGATDRVDTNTVFSTGVVTTNALAPEVDLRYVNAEGDTVGPIEVSGGEAPGDYMMRIYSGSNIVAWARKK